MTLSQSYKQNDYVIFMLKCKIKIGEKNTYLKYSHLRYGRRGCKEWRKTNYASMTETHLPCAMQFMRQVRLDEAGRGGTIIVYGSK